MPTLLISGGCDSVALTRIFYSFLKKIDLRLELVHFHHGIRKKRGCKFWTPLVKQIQDVTDKMQYFKVFDYSFCYFVLDLAKKLSLKCHLFKNKSITPQIFKEKARKWRYQKLEFLKQKENFQFVVLGHQLEDLVETQIWRLLRGTSLFDLSAISYRQKFYLRPLPTLHF